MVDDQKQDGRFPVHELHALLALSLELGLAGGRYQTFPVIGGEIFRMMKILPNLEATTK